MEGFNWSILGWIGGLVFVYLFGIFEGRTQGRKRRMDEEALERKERPEPIPQQIKVDDPGILRIKNDQGKLTLEIDGQNVNPTALPAESRKRLIEILNVMRPWLDGKPASPHPSATISSSEGITQNPAPKPALQKMESSPFSTTLIKNEEPELPPTSIVGQINFVLQQQIVKTPLAEQGIKLIESLTGGVTFIVGSNSYESIDDIPDEIIKSAIRDAIAAWEKKNTPS